MLVGARTATWAGSGWKNPYITDGLVAMWDGEWNAGGGRHATNPSSIKSLGYLDIDAVVKGLPTYESNAMVAGGTGAWIADLSSAYPTNADKLALLNNFSIEIGLEPTAYTNIDASNIAMFYSGYENRAFASNWYTGSNNLYCFGNVNYKATSYNALRRGPNISTMPKMACVYRGYGTTLTMDELVSGHSSTLSAGTATSFEKGLLSFGCAYDASTLFAPARIYYVRLYSRALTADEIAHNYAIDRERFNLP